ncbi:C-5 cytosine-specific DNA methylase [Clostridium sp. C105KSO15]|nr:C-5 cytosine-specific DNA methylase [Clostridium sp. C105KSO15]
MITHNKCGALKVLSLCGGVETGLYALQKLGIPVKEYHTYEILPEAIAVSNYHFPFIVHHGDLYNADFEQFKGFDLILAGTCCQSLSRVRIENKEVNNGLNGKSGIFFEAIKALNIIKPRWVMFENVIPSNNEDLKTMTELIGIDPILINSNLFSAQDRERYYWTNIPLDNLPGGNSLSFKDVKEDNVNESYFYDKPFKVIDLNKKVCGELQVNTTEMCKRIYNPGHKIATLTCVSGGYQEKKIFDGGRPRKLTAVEYERLQGFSDGFTDVRINGKKLSYTKRCSLMGNSWNEPTVEFILKNLKQYISN